MWTTGFSAPVCAVTAWTGSSSSPCTPWGCHSNSATFGTMGAVSCSCFLFPVSVSWYYSPKRKLAHVAPASLPLFSDAALCKPLHGPVWPFITTSPRPGWLVACRPITCSADLSFHRPIVWTGRGDTMARCERENVLLRCFLSRCHFSQLLGLFKIDLRGCEVVSESIYEV